MCTTRRRHTAKVKLALVTAVLRDGRSPGAVCRDMDIAPSLYYRWLRQFVDHAADRMSGRSPECSVLRARIEVLRTELEATEAQIEAELRALTERRLDRWGPLRGRWVPAEVRDQVVDFVDAWSVRQAARTTQLLGWLGVSAAKFYDWRRRKGQPNRHNGREPRSHQVSEQERRRVIEYADRHPGLGYRRIARALRRSCRASLSASSVYRILRDAGYL